VEVFVGTPGWMYGWNEKQSLDEELREVATKILEAKSDHAYIIFNNNHAVLDNSRKSC